MHVQAGRQLSVALPVLVRESVEGGCVALPTAEGSNASSAREQYQCNMPQGALDLAGRQVVRRDSLAATVCANALPLQCDSTRIFPLNGLEPAATTRGAICWRNGVPKT